MCGDKKLLTAVKNFLKLLLLLKKRMAGYSEFTVKNRLIVNLKTY